MAVSVVTTNFISIFFCCQYYLKVTNIKDMENTYTNGFVYKKNKIEDEDYRMRHSILNAI